MDWLCIFADCVLTIPAPHPGGGYLPAQGADEVGEEFGGLAQVLIGNKGGLAVGTMVQCSLHGDLGMPGQPLWLRLWLQLRDTLGSSGQV